MNWKKNDIFQVKIEDISDTGEGIGKTDGFTWFIKDAVIGDIVEAKVMKTKKSYGFARLIHVLEPSFCRVEPSCSVARQCGGCQLQAMCYEEQLRFKENKVRNNLQRIGGLENICMMSDENGTAPTQGTQAGIQMYPIIGMENPWRYRNKAQFPFGKSKDGKIITGFYAGRTHAIIENDDCLLGVEENRPILECIRAHMEKYQIRPYDEENHSGLVRHVLIRKGFKTGEMMVCLVINGLVKQVKRLDILAEQLVHLFDDREDVRMVSISCSINTEKTNVIMGKDIIHLYGPGYITDYIGNVQYRISPLSFYQVNPVQTERLYKTALEYAELTGEETVWDLYCGIGTISLFLAQKAKYVYGVEIVPQAIEDARANAALNGMKNVEFFVGKAEEVLPEQYEKNRVYADVIVVDPPRKGCDSVCLDTIVKMEPKRVVYVSCDSATLARDVKYLGERGYKVEKVRTVDMFPGGVHVETVVLLSKGEVDSKKIRVEFSLEDMDMSEFQDGATYPQIKEYVLEHTGLKVSNLYISQIKRKCGIEVGKNYNLPKSEDSRQPQCPPEKEKAIREALKYYGMI
ncbi:MAG: 23S rRNA (uracil(1939)-C(5))-methyltransferase RlmD [Brotaphodocola sp.]